jgi:hypothetical protein
MGQLFLHIYTNQTTSSLVHSWSTFGAWMSHGHTQTHKIHRGLDLGETITFPLIVFYMIFPWGLHPNVIFSRIPKLRVLKLGLLSLWMTITSCADFRLKWGFKKNYSPCWNLSKDIWHASCTHVIQGDS